MKLVILESPYAGEIERNVTYARQCMRDCLERGEAPFASHLLYTQPGILRDDDLVERALGIKAGLAWAAATNISVIYTDLGISPGMQQGIDDAEASGRWMERRTLWRRS